MNCFECAKANDAVPAVGICHHCSVGVCLDQLIEAKGIAASARHYSAAVS